MNIRKFLTYAAFDTWTIFLPIIVACDLNVVDPYCIVGAIIVRATVMAVGRDSGNTPPSFRNEPIGDLN